MEKEILVPGIELYKNIFLDSEDLVNEIEDICSQGLIKWEKRDVFLHERENQIYRDNYSITIPYDFNNRNTFIAEAMSELSQTFKKNLNECIVDYVKSNHAQTESSTGYEMIKYEVGGRWENHYHDTPLTPSRIVAEYFFNDDYQGGEITFYKFGFKFKPPKKSLLIYPSGFVYNNSVSEIISGTKYSLTQLIR